MASRMESRTTCIRRLKEADAATFAAAWGGLPGVGVIGMNPANLGRNDEINLFDALAFTIDRMKDVQGRKAILVICTGYDTFSKLTYDQTLKIVRNSDTAIYPISILEFITVRYPQMETVDALQARNALATIAKYSGGQAYFPRFEAELPSIYEQVAGQLRLQYSLGFVPTNPAKDGKFHKLKVELVDPQGNPLRIVNQKGKKRRPLLLQRRVTSSNTQSSLESLLSK
jgi:VWFA-related protein